MHHIDDSTINEYLDFALSATRRAEVEAHLATCPACATRLTALRALFASIAALPDSPLERDLSPAILNSIKHVPASRPALAPAIRLVFAAQAVFAFIALAVVIPFAITLFPTETAAQFTEQASADLAQLVEAFSSQGSTTLTALETTFANLTITPELSLPALPMYALLAALAAATLLFIIGNGLLLRTTPRVERGH